MRLITGTSASLQPDFLADIARYRYDVFVQHLGWSLRHFDEELMNKNQFKSLQNNQYKLNNLNKNNLDSLDQADFGQAENNSQQNHPFEFDQFDHAQTVYVNIVDHENNIIANARLLPTLGAYLLKDVFPSLMPKDCLPQSPKVLELSRFSAINLNEFRGKNSSKNIEKNQQDASLAPFSSALAKDLLKACMETAAFMGASHLITVSPVGVERLLKKAGVYAYRAGSPLLINHQMIAAFWIPTHLQNQGDLFKDFERNGEIK